MKIKEALHGTCHLYHKRWYYMKYGLGVFKENAFIDDDLYIEKCT
jgi:hypothetical protein